MQGQSTGAFKVPCAVMPGASPVTPYDCLSFAAGLLMVCAVCASRVLQHSPLETLGASCQEAVSPVCARLCVRS